MIVTMKTKWYLVALGLLLLFFGVPFAVAGMIFIYRGVVVFDVVEFSNDYLDFMIGLLAMAISFWLANVYWTDRIKQERISRARITMIRFFRRLYEMTDQCEILLKKQCKEIKENQDRDRKVIELFLLMGQVKAGLLLHYPEDEIEQDECLSHAMIELFWTGLVPAINDLNSRQTIRGEIDAIRSKLEHIKQYSYQTLSALKANPTQEIISSETGDYYDHSEAHWRSA